MQGKSALHAGADAFLEIRDFFQNRKTGHKPLPRVSQGQRVKAGVTQVQGNFFDFFWGERRQRQCNGIQLGPLIRSRLLEVRMDPRTI